MSSQKIAQKRRTWPQVRMFVNNIIKNSLEKYGKSNLMVNINKYIVRETTNAI